MEMDVEEMSKLTHRMRSIESKSAMSAMSLIPAPNSKKSRPLTQEEELAVQRAENEPDNPISIQDAKRRIDSIVGW